MTQQKHYNQTRKKFKEIRSQKKEKKYAIKKNKTRKLNHQNQLNTAYPVKEKESQQIFEKSKILFMRQTSDNSMLIYIYMK